MAKSKLSLASPFPINTRHRCDLALHLIALRCSTVFTAGDRQLALLGALCIPSVFFTPMFNASCQLTSIQGVMRDDVVATMHTSVPAAQFLARSFAEHARRLGKQHARCFAKLLASWAA